MIILGNLSLLVVIDNLGLSFNKLGNQTVLDLFGGKVLVDPDMNVLLPANVQFSAFNTTEDIVFTADYFRVYITCDQVMLHVESLGFATPFILSEC